MLKFARGIAEQAHHREQKYQQLNTSQEAVDAISKDLVSALGHPSTKSSFKKKRYRRFIFRNQKCPQEPGIVLFLSKPPPHDDLEQLIFTIFHKSYPDVKNPSFLYFNENNNIVPFSKIKKNAYTFIYITDSLSDPDSDSVQSLTANRQNKDILLPIDKQRENLDLYVLHESLYDQYLSGALDLENVEDSYAELQFFLEKCSQGIWNYLEDFADVSYRRRKHLADIVDTIDQKKQDVIEVKQVLLSVLAEFEEQEQIVKNIFSSLGFTNSFVESTIPLASRISSSSLPSSSAFKYPTTTNTFFETQQENQDNHQRTFQTDQDDFSSGGFDFLPRNAKDV